MQAAITVTSLASFNTQKLRAIPGNKNHAIERSREDALNNLCLYITKLTKMTISDGEYQAIEQAFKYKSIRRRQYLLQEGDICRYFSFIVSGAMRMYSVNERGQESTVFLSIENDWSVNRESMELHTPSQYHIEAVEASEVLLITAAQMDALKLTIPAIAEMLRIQSMQMAIATQNRIHVAISMTAEERYQDLICTKPEYFQRFSQNTIASYLGIKPETLSRVRKR